MEKINEFFANVIKENTINNNSNTNNNNNNNDINVIKNNMLGIVSDDQQQQQQRGNSSLTNIRNIQHDTIIDYNVDNNIAKIEEPIYSEPKRNNKRNKSIKNTLNNKKQKINNTLRKNKYKVNNNIENITIQHNDKIKNGLDYLFGGKKNDIHENNDLNGIDDGQIEEEDDQKIYKGFDLIDNEYKYKLIRDHIYIKEKEKIYNAYIKNKNNIPKLTLKTKKTRKINDIKPLRHTFNDSSIFDDSNSLYLDSESYNNINIKQTHEIYDNKNYDQCSKNNSNNIGDTNSENINTEGDNSTNSSNDKINNDNNNRNFDLESDGHNSYDDSDQHLFDEKEQNNILSEVISHCVLCGASVVPEIGADVLVISQILNFIETNCGLGNDAIKARNILLMRQQLIEKTMIKQKKACIFWSELMIYAHIIGLCGSLNLMRTNNLNITKCQTLIDHIYQNNILVESKNSTQIDKESLDKLIKCINTQKTLISMRQSIQKNEYSGTPKEQYAKQNISSNLLNFFADINNQVEPYLTLRTKNKKNNFAYNSNNSYISNTSVSSSCKNSNYYNI